MEFPDWVQIKEKTQQMSCPIKLPKLEIYSKPAKKEK